MISRCLESLLVWWNDSSQCHSVLSPLIYAIKASWMHIQFLHTKGRVSSILKVWEWQQLLFLDTIYIQRSTSQGAKSCKTHSPYTSVLQLHSLLQISTDIFYWQCELTEGKNHTVWHYALGNQSSLLRELIGSSTAKVAAGLPIHWGSQDQSELRLVCKTPSKDNE